MFCLMSRHWVRQVGLLVVPVDVRFGLTLDVGCVPELISKVTSRLVVV